MHKACPLWVRSLFIIHVTVFACRYDLVGVVVHHGHSVHSGHYIAYVRAVGIWYVCDDARVARCAERVVLGQKAYMLMYARREPRTWLINKAAPPRVLQPRSQNVAAKPPAVAIVAAVADKKVAEAAPVLAETVIAAPAIVDASDRFALH